jgi:ankyrin repeat protein
MPPRELVGVATGAESDAALNAATSSSFLRCGNSADPTQGYGTANFSTNVEEQSSPSNCHTPLTAVTSALNVDETTCASAAGNQQVQPQFQVGGTFNQQPPPLMYHPSFLYDLLYNPHQQMSYEQQQALLFQHQLMVQQVAQQSILLHQLQLQSQAIAASAAAAVASFQQIPSLHVPSQQKPIRPPFDPQQMGPQSAALQHQLQFMQHQLQQSQYNTALLSQGAQLLGQQDSSTMVLQAPPCHMPHPFWYNAQLLYGNTPAPVGVEEVNQGVESIYQEHQEMDTSNVDDVIVDENNEDYDDDDDDDDDFNSSSRSLHRLVEDHQWVAALQRMATHPHETQQVGIQGRTPLHVACDNDAPPCVVQALLNLWPEGADRVGTSHMNPLHITCSSPNASAEIVRILLAGCRDPFKLTGAKDVDGDTSLHAACRCAAPMNVLLLLLQANPITVTWKDYEGLNPLMRLWVRYFVLVGEQIISNIKHPSDLTSDLVEAWEKSLLLLRVMDAMERRGSGEQVPEGSFRSVHAASSVNCPRCVVRIAMVLFPEELLRRDEKNRLPIHIAAVAPVYAVNDLRGEGFTLDDAFIDDDPEAARLRRKKSPSKYKEPSVIDILLSGEPRAAQEPDPNGQLPLHVAIMRGKTLDEGIQALVEAYPDALTIPDSRTNLYPFMLAASVGRGRGDCGTIYALLRAAPELVLMALMGEEQEEDGKISSELELTVV